MAIRLKNFRWDDDNRKIVDVVSDEWADGSIWLLRGGEDWTGSPGDFADHLEDKYKSTHHVRVGVFKGGFELVRTSNGWLTPTTDDEVFLLGPIDIIFQAVPKARTSETDDSKKVTEKKYRISFRFGKDAS